MPADGCAPDITETNYVNIGYVVRVLIGQFGPAMTSNSFSFWNWILQLQYEIGHLFFHEHLQSIGSRKKHRFDDVL
jgi:hypothetical protein